MDAETKKEIESLLAEAADCEEWADVRAQQAERFQAESNDSAALAREYREKAQERTGPVMPPETNQTDKLLEAVALAVRTVRGLPSVKNEPNTLAGVDKLVCLIGLCCKDTDDMFSLADYLRLCGVRQ
jgi:Skp family chaperone for outer membrane proteins